jgi:hypothetical protein
VVPDDLPEERRTLAAGCAIARDPGVPADIIPCRKSVFERRRRLVGTLSHAVAKEGILVYGRE